MTNYDDIHQLFKSAHDKHGRVDHAISCAGIFEKGNWYDPKLTIDNIKDSKGDLSTLEVNVLGTLHFSRIAAVFLRDGIRRDEDRSLTLLSSVNAFRESPGLFIYQVSTNVSGNQEATLTFKYRLPNTPSTVSSAHLERRCSKGMVFE